MPKDGPYHFASSVSKDPFVATSAYRGLLIPSTLFTYGGFVFGFFLSSGNRFF